MKLKQLGIDTYRESVVYIRHDCPICFSEGLGAQARVMVRLGTRTIVATLNIISTDILQPGEASLSDYAWQRLEARAGDLVDITHTEPLTSLSDVRAKIYGETMNQTQFNHIIDDVSNGHYSDIHLSAFLTACAGGRLNKDEIYYLTDAMIHHGEILKWSQSQVVDKHCVGGLPGNRTSLIIVPIVAAFGLLIPKTSSRAITSPAGTADTMEVFAPVQLGLAKIRDVVEQEGGCIVWGGAATLSPADDMLIRVERALDIDSEGQLVASVLSKKIAAGSNHIVIDIPMGPTAKVRTQQSAENLMENLTEIGSRLGVKIRCIITNGSQPVGRGIGPALEAREVIKVLENHPDAPDDLRTRALTLAGHILEFSDQVASGTGFDTATEILTSGAAWKKFQAICEAQGGMHLPSHASHTHTIIAENQGMVTSIDNRKLARAARLAGAPQDKAAGIELHCQLNDTIESSQPIYTVHAESQGALDYALTFIKDNPLIVSVDETL